MRPDTSGYVPDASRMRRDFEFRQTSDVRTNFGEFFLEDLFWQNSDTKFRQKIGQISLSFFSLQTSEQNLGKMI